jgi:hypothetical protein
MAIQNKPSTPTTTRPAADLSAGFTEGAPKVNNREYVRSVHVMWTLDQYAAIEQAVLDRGWPRHGGPSRLIREIIARELGIEP